LQQEELKAILYAEKRGKQRSSNTRLTKSPQLITAGQLEEVPAFLADLGVDGEPVFATLDLFEQIALYQMKEDASDNFRDWSSNAASFAVEMSNTPLEFIDFFGFYSTLWNRLAANEGDDSEASERQKKKRFNQRDKVIRLAAEENLPLMWPMIFSPTFEEAPSPDELQRFLQFFINNGQKVGFPRASRALEQVYRNTGLTSETGFAAQKAISRYYMEIQVFLQSFTPSPPQLSQDGFVCAYFYNEEGVGSAVLTLAPNGNLSVYEASLPESAAGGSEDAGAETGKPDGSGAAAK
jgi:hypothetical protein